MEWTEEDEDIWYWYQWMDIMEPYERAEEERLEAPRIISNEELEGVF